MMSHDSGPLTKYAIETRSPVLSLDGLTMCAEIRKQVCDQMTSTVDGHQRPAMPASALLE